MNIREAMEIILCNPETGVLWDKKIKGKDFILKFGENSSADCSQWIEVYFVGKTTYRLASTIPVDWYGKVDKKYVDEFLLKEYLLENEDVKIVDKAS